MQIIFRIVHNELKCMSSIYLWCWDDVTSFVEFLVKSCIDEPTFVTINVRSIDLQVHVNPVQQRYSSNEALVRARGSFAWISVELMNRVARKVVNGQTLNLDAQVRSYLGVFWNLTLILQRHCWRIKLVDAI